MSARQFEPPAKPQRRMTGRCRQHRPFERRACRGQFHDVAEKFRYDVERLSAYYSASYETPARVTAQLANIGVALGGIVAGAAIRRLTITSAIRSNNCTSSTARGRPSSWCCRIMVAP